MRNIKLELLVGLSEKQHADLIFHLISSELILEAEISEDESHVKVNVSDEALKTLNDIAKIGILFNEIITQITKKEIEFKSEITGKLSETMTFAMKPMNDNQALLMIEKLESHQIVENAEISKNVLTIKGLNTGGLTNGEFHETIGFVVGKVVEQVIGKITDTKTPEALAHNRAIEDSENIIINLINKEGKSPNRGLRRAFAQINDLLIEDK